MTRKKKNRQRNVPGQQDNLQRQEREGANSREDAAAQERFAGTNESGVNDQQKGASGTSASFQGSSKQESSQGQGPVNPIIQESRRGNLDEDQWQVMGTKKPSGQSGIDSERNEENANSQQWRKQSSRGRGTASGRGAQSTQVEPFGSQPTQQQPARNIQSSSRGGTANPRNRGQNRAAQPSERSREPWNIGNEQQDFAPKQPVVPERKSMLSSEGSSLMTFEDRKTQKGAASSQLQGKNFPSESFQAPMATVRPKTKGRNRIGTPAVDTAQQEHLDSKHQISGSASEDLEASEEMCKILKHMGMLTKPKPIKRPDDGGILGTPVKLMTNHFPVKIRTEPAQNCFQYDVEITPKLREKKLSANLKRKVLKQFLRDNLKLDDKEQGFTYDGDKKAYSPHRIESIEKVEFEFGDGEEKRISLSISLKIVGNQVDMSLISDYARKVHDSEKPQQVLDVCNTMYKAMLHGVGDFVTLKRAVFSRKFGKEVDLRGGLDLWFGYQPSFVMGSWNVYLQVDLTSKPFTRQMNAIKFVEDVLGRPVRFDSVVNPADSDKLSRALAGRKIKLQHNKRERTIADVVKFNSLDKTFQNSGKTVNVVDYYGSTYNRHIKYRYLPLVRTEPKKRDNCYPMEICDIVGDQPWSKKLPEWQQAIMTKNGAVYPSTRINFIVKMLNYQTNPNASEQFKQFNLEVDTQMAKVDARVIPGPPMIGQGGAKVYSQSGKYDDRRLGFFEPAEHLKNYVVACPKFLQENINPLHNAMLKQGGVINWPQGGPQNIYLLPRNMEQAEQVFRQIGNDHKRSKKSFDLVFVILGDKSWTDIYEAAKYIFDIEFKLPSQVLVLKTISGRFRGEAPKPQNISNILKKINTKLGGINVATFTDYLTPYSRTLREVVNQFKEIYEEPLMVFGADVTHPDPREQGKPSIAAVVGSLNSTLTRYGAQVMVQRSRQEMISDLEEMFTTILKEFKRLTKNQVPQRILYYRDGVSEGQFTDVLIKELYAMQQACKKLNPNFTPKITFIVVNKRHKARFVEPLPNGNLVNMAPGTLIDKKVVHPFNFDFYLCSHEGIIGTSRPAHYHVLYDDSNFKSDTLQAFTFALCHLYARCARAVSYPPPTYYAHHAATRARNHANYLMKKYPDDSSSSSSSDTKGRIEASSELIKYLNERLRRELNERYPMYFI